MLFGPVTRLTDTELDTLLDTALAIDDSRTITEICDEKERRGDLIEV